MREPKVVGVCPGCAGAVVSGEGVRTDPERRTWHPACRLKGTTVIGPRTVGKSSAMADAELNPPKRRGRPPKQRPADA